jgi:hypothetical protein
MVMEWLAIHGDAGHTKFVVYVSVLDDPNKILLAWEDASWQPGEEQRLHRGISHTDWMGWWPLLLSSPIQDNSLGHEPAFSMD